MSNRYINSSERTKALAEGIWLIAQIQDMPAVKAATSTESKVYAAWVERWGTEMDITARQEQYNLFDRTNNREWG